MKVATYMTDFLPGPAMENFTIQARETLKAGNVDVVCMQGAFAEEDVIKAGLAEYPYVYAMPKEAGKVPCKCEAEELGAVLADALTCMSSTCNGLAGYDFIGCLFGEECLGKHQKTTSERCIGCLASGYTSNPTILENPMALAAMCTRGKNDAERDETKACEGPNQGTTGVVVASKLPFTSTKPVYFPNSVVANKGFAHVTVEAACGHPVEVLCGHWRKNDLILPWGSMEYFKPQAQSNAEAFYGAAPDTPASEATMQSKYTADYVSKNVGNGSVALITGTFGAGPKVASTNIHGVHPDMYKIHDDNFKAKEFSNPMVESDAPMCSECGSREIKKWMAMDKEATMASMRDWMGNMSDSQMMAEIDAMSDALIDHIWIRKNSDTKSVTPFQPTLAHPGVRFPIGVSFTVDVGDSPDSCPTTPTTTTTAPPLPQQTSSASERSASLLVLSTCMLFAFLKFGSDASM